MAEGRHHPQPASLLDRGKGKPGSWATTPAKRRRILDAALGCFDEKGMAATTIDDICAIDLEANQLEGRGNAPLERHLHCGIYRVRPDVRAIVHAHPKWSTFLTMVGESYKPVYAQGALVHPVPLLDSPNSINNRAMADRLAATLGDRPAALMKSHGAVTVGKDIVEAFVLANYMEENSYRQYMALQIGKPYVFSDEEIALCREKLWNAGLFKRTWDHFRAKLG